MTTTVENIVTNTDIAYAVGTAANAWGDTDYWVDETGETIGLKRSTTHDGLSALTDETIAYLADWWLEH